MFGIHLFSPKYMVKEVMHFKSNHTVYVSKHFDSGTAELWCYTAKPKQQESTSFFLGTFIKGIWDQPKKLHTYEYDWHVKKGAIRLHQALLKKLELTEVEEKIEKPAIYTREYFAEMGKRGQEKVKEKYNVSSAVKLRWAKKKIDNRSTKV